MECPICFNLIENSCVGSCMHHFCYICLIKWLERADSCPTCKKPIFEIKFDKEFDSINNPDTPVFLQEVTKKITMTFKEKDHPGIVISTNKNGPGIKIVNLNKKDLCYRSGLRIGDIIIFLNSIPCYSHHQSIEIIKNANIHKKELICELLIIKK